MKKIIFAILIFTLSIHSNLFSQVEKLEVEGAIQIGNSEDPSPDAGTIRWNGIDFEGWDGTTWKSLTFYTNNLDGLTGKVYDIEGNSYNTVFIGGQQWMSENLKVTKYNDGTIIPEVSDYSVWATLTTGAWCYYDYNPSYDLNYGKLYNWYSVETGQLCPESWHVPTHSDWVQLHDYLGGVQSGGKLKTTGPISLWEYPNTGATNVSGFSATPSGMLPNSTFQGLNRRTSYWSSTTDTNYTNTAFSPTLTHHTKSFKINDSLNKNSGLGVICIKD